MRLGDLDAFKDQWNEDSYVGKIMRAAIDELPTIDPEMLPAIQELRKSWEKSCETVRQQKEELDRRDKVIHELEKQLDQAIQDSDFKLKVALENSNRWKEQVNILQKQHELGEDVTERIQKKGRSCMETYLNFASQTSLDDKTSAFYRGAAAAVNDLLCQIGYGEMVEDLAAHLQIGELTKEE